MVWLGDVQLADFSFLFLWNKNIKIKWGDPGEVTFWRGAFTPSVNRLSENCSEKLGLVSDEIQMIEDDGDSLNAISVTSTLSPVQITVGPAEKLAGTTRFQLGHTWEDE